MINRHEQRYLVDVSSQYMALFAEVGGLTNNVVAPLADIGNPTDVTGIACKTALL